MKRGWFRDSLRHALAAKGLKTSVKKVRSKKGRFDWKYHRMFFSSKGVKFFEPELRLGSGVSAFESITGLKEPEFLRGLVPEVPRKVGLSKREAAREVGREQRVIASESDAAARKILKGRNADPELSAVFEAQRAQDLARRGVGERFVGGRPLSESQRVLLGEVRVKDRTEGLRRSGLL